MKEEEARRQKIVEAMHAQQEQLIQERQRIIEDSRQHQYQLAAVSKMTTVMSMVIVGAAVFLYFADNDRAAYFLLALLFILQNLTLVTTKVLSTAQQSAAISLSMAQPTQVFLRPVHEPTEAQS